MTSPLEQKIRITGPSMITANRTFDGAVIYRTAAKSWSTDLSDAAIVRNADEARALLAESVADDLGAVGAYIALSKSGMAARSIRGICANTSARAGSLSIFRFPFEVN